MKDKFIHHQPPEIFGTKLAVQTLQSLAIDRLDGVPTKACELADVWNWQELGQRFYPASQPMGDSASPDQPRNVLNHSG